MATEPSLTDPADEHGVVPVPAAVYEVMLRDALRYRWLRKWVPDQNGLEDHMAGLGIEQPMSPEGLDAALDTAMKAESPPQ